MGQRVITKKKGPDGTVLNLCWVKTTGQGVRIHKCGFCGRGNVEPKVGAACKVCRAKVAQVRVDAEYGEPCL